MNAPVSQRVALVTGGAARLGRALSLGLARDGYDLLVSYLSSEEEARSLQQEVQELGRQCETVRADLTEAPAAVAVVDAARDTFARLDLLVNSAASFAACPLLEVDADEWDSVMDLNVRAPHLLVRAAAGLLTEAKGSVVNIADLAAFQAWTDRPHHAVSKAALVHLTKVQARALAPDVRVNAVAPGSVLRPRGWSEDQWLEIANRAPVARPGTPADVVQAVLYLARADFVTGQVIAVDGGRLLNP
jgi:NAD(P)-dependent dehydrogenase (short-subunit alcohol dehydrogenase family)